MLNVELIYYVIKQSSFKKKKKKSVSVTASNPRLPKELLHFIHPFYKSLCSHFSTTFCDNLTTIKTIKITAL